MVKLRQSAGSASASAPIEKRVAPHKNQNLPTNKVQKSIASPNPFGALGIEGANDDDDEDEESPSQGGKTIGDQAEATPIDTQSEKEVELTAEATKSSSAEDDALSQASAEMAVEKAVAPVIAAAPITQEKSTPVTRVLGTAATAQATTSAAPAKQLAAKVSNTARPGAAVASGSVAPRRALNVAAGKATDVKSTLTPAPASSQPSSTTMLASASKSNSDSRPDSPVKKGLRSSNH